MSVLLKHSNGYSQRGEDGWMNNKKKKDKKSTVLVNFYGWVNERIKSPPCRLTSMVE